MDCKVKGGLGFFFQPKTAHVTLVRVRTEGRVWEEATPSTASAKMAGKDPPVNRVRPLESIVGLEQRPVEIITFSCVAIKSDVLLQKKKQSHQVLDSLVS